MGMQTTEMITGQYMTMFESRMSVRALEQLL